MSEQRNVLGGPLAPCCFEPMTGFFRDGYCHTRADDLGSHTVCVEVSENFLRYSQAQGNDMSTPHPDWNFPGLVAGDKWCLCASRWLQAYEDGMAPRVYLEGCNEAALEIVPLAALKSHAVEAEVTS